MQRSLPLPPRPRAAAGAWTLAALLAALLVGGCAWVGGGGVSCKQRTTDGLFMVRGRDRDGALADALASTPLGQVRGVRAYHFVQRFPNTARGHSGIAGRALSGAWTTVVHSRATALVARDGVPEYYVRLDYPQARVMMTRDLRSGCVAGAHWALDRYGHDAVHFTK